MTSPTSKGAAGVDRLRNPESRTEYFEIDSTHVGYSFGISVSLPRTYDDSADVDHPLLYATDGNVFGPIAEAVMCDFFEFDAVQPVQAYVQVSIGFPGDQAAQASTLRIRSLFPPGESVPDLMEEHVLNRLGPGSFAAWSENYKAAHADKFLAFIEEELHPEICRRYSVREDAVGLFGYSSGGMFSLYALTSGSRLFTRYGAASPYLPTADSQVFGRYAEMVQRRRDTESRVHLHLSVNTSELFGPVRLYRMNAVGLLRFFDLVAEQPLPGLRVTTDVLNGEAHGSGWLDGYRSFVRSCYREGS